MLSSRRWVAAVAVWLVVMVSIDGLEYSVMEAVGEERGGITLGNIINNTRLSNTYNATILSNLRLSLIPASSHPINSHRFFNIEPNGDLELIEAIDRDTECPAQTACTFVIDIQVSPDEFFDIFRVQLNILDINDNAPVFNEQAISRSIPEGPRIGSTISLPRAYDLDSPANGIVKYELITNTSLFGLSAYDEGANEVYLEVLGDLDREEASSHVIILVAVDGGVPSRSGMLPITIHIADINDHSPAFTNQTYVTHIAENTLQDRPIISVYAVDRDAGVNAQVAYSFSSSTVQMYGDMFLMNRSTGDVYLLSPLDYEQQSKYSLTILAMDLTLRGQPAQSRVLVQVLDENDNAPDIILRNDDVTSDVTSARANMSVVILEEQPTPTFILHFSVRDLDQGENGRFACQLNTNLLNLRRLYETEFVVESATMIDREVQESMGFVITCRDKGSPSLFSMATVLVLINDINDNPPVFEQVRYSAEISPLHPPPQLLIQVTATDPDMGNNGYILYSLLATQQESIAKILAIDPITGVVTATELPDIGAHQQVNVTVRATDQGVPQRSSHAILSLRITSDGILQKNSFNFDQDSYTFVVRENLANGSNVGRLSRDSTQSHNASCYLANEDVDQIPFALDVSQGVALYSTGPLDREIHAIYNFTIIALIVSNTVSITRQANIVVKVEDINDNWPVFVLPREDNTTVSVPCSGTDMSDDVTKLVADDPDVGNNSALFYTLANHDLQHIFALNMTSGVLRLNTTTPCDLVGIYILKVKVSDGGTPRRSSYLTFIVSILASTDDGLLEGNFLVLLAVCSFTGFAILISCALCVVLRCKRTTQRQKIASSQYTLRKYPNLSQAIMKKRKSRGAASDYTIPDVLWVSGVQTDAGNNARDRLGNGDASRRIQPQHPVGAMSSRSFNAGSGARPPQAVPCPRPPTAHAQSAGSDNRHVYENIPYYRQGSWPHYEGHFREDYVILEESLITQDQTYIGPHNNIHAPRRLHSMPPTIPTRAAATRLRSKARNNRRHVSNSSETQSETQPSHTSVSGSTKQRDSCDNGSRSVTKKRVKTSHSLPRKRGGGMARSLTYSPGLVAYSPGLMKALGIGSGGDSDNEGFIHTPRCRKPVRPCPSQESLERKGNKFVSSDEVSDDEKVDPVASKSTSHCESGGGGHVGSVDGDWMDGVQPLNQGSWDPELDKLRPLSDFQVGQHIQQNQSLTEEGSNLESESMFYQNDNSQGVIDGSLMVSPLIQQSRRNAPPRGNSTHQRRPPAEATPTSHSATMPNRKREKTNCPSPRYVSLTHLNTPVNADYGAGCLKSDITSHGAFRSLFVGEGDVIGEGDDSVFLPDVPAQRTPSVKRIIREIHV